MNMVHLVFQLIFGNPRKTFIDSFSHPTINWKKLIGWNFHFQLAKYARFIFVSSPFHLFCNKWAIQIGPNHEPFAFWIHNPCSGQRPIYELLVSRVSWNKIQLLVSYPQQRLVFSSYLFVTLMRSVLSQHTPGHTLNLLMLIKRTTMLNWNSRLYQQSCQKWYRKEKRIITVHSLIN